MSYFVLLSLAALLAVWFIRGSVRHKRLVSGCEAIFRKIYAAPSPMPRLEIGSSYSYPTFTLTFLSKREREAADEAGLNQSFKHEIDMLCRDYGSKSNPFDADKAVWFTYQGWLEEQAARDRQTLAEMNRD